MPISPRAWRLAAAVLLPLLLAPACGGGGGGGGGGREGCPQRIPFRATYLPEGFDDEPVAGPGGDGEPVKNTVAYHYQGPGGAFIDIFRGGRRNQMGATTAARVLGRTARVGRIDDGFAMRLRMGRTTCNTYQLEGFGIEEEEWVKVLGGLRAGQIGEQQDD